jgi:hypothetical protein
MTRDDIRLRLRGTFEQLMSDSTVRRRFLSNPHAVLAEFGYPAELVGPNTHLHLPDRASVYLDPDTLFGPDIPPATDEGVTAEARLVAAGYKPGALLFGSEQNLAAVSGWAWSQGLTAVLTAHAFGEVLDAGKGGFSNRTGERRPARSGEGGRRSMVVASDPGVAALGWLAVLFGWDEILGGVLGYPACCREFFAQNWAGAIRDHQGDMAVVSFRASPPGPYDYRYNIFARYFGTQLLYHFPCSFTCAATRLVADAYLAGLAANMPRYAARLLPRLGSPVVFSETDGVFLLTGATSAVNPDGRTGKVAYEPTRLEATTRETALAAALLGANELTVRPGRVDVDGRVFDAEYIPFFAEAVADSSMTTLVPTSQPVRRPASRPLHLPRVDF